MEVVDVPLCIDTADPEALEAALKAYEGKPLINSVNGEERSLAAVLPLVKEYGAAVIGLCMDDNGISTNADERLKVAAKILERAGKLGIPAQNIVIDPLALTMGSDHTAGLIAFPTIKGDRGFASISRWAPATSPLACQTANTSTLPS
jgi:5-methyltetrahydrofolate--homocysteine methyltransferase